MKEVYSIYIDKELKKKFIDYCEEHNLNKSAIIQRMLEKFLEEMEKEVKHKWEK